MEDIPSAPFGKEAARAYGPDFAWQLTQQDRDALDKLIAAHAVSLDVTLVTNNSADFAGYPGSRSENWVLQQA